VSVVAVPKWWGGIASKVLAHKLDRFLTDPSDGNERFGFGPVSGTGWVTESCLFGSMVL
jgi:hypothetical protein